MEEEGDLPTSLKALMGSERLNVTATSDSVSFTFNVDKWAGKSVN